MAALTDQAIAEIAREVMKADFRAIDPTETRVLLVEAGPRVLATFPESLSARVQAVEAAVAAMCIDDD